MANDVVIAWDTRFPEIREVVKAPPVRTITPSEARDLAGRLLDAALRVERAGKEASRGA